jgi:hypothetical protein
MAASKSWSRRHFKKSKSGLNPRKVGWAWDHEPTPGFRRILPAEVRLCIVRGCLAAAAGLRCRSHQAELERLIKSQGKEWGRDRRTTDVRFFYASRKGHHAY